MSLLGYDISVEGTTYSGNTDFYYPGYTTFSLIGSFNSPGYLVETTVPLDPYAVTGNGVNVMDIALLVGTPFAGSPHLGDLIWASNTGLESVFVSSTTAPVSLDQVTQTFDGTSRTLKSVIDENTVRKITSEFFVQQSGLLGFPWEIDAGEIDITFSADMKSLAGSATFISDGYVGPGTFAWAATFTGTLATPVPATSPHDFNSDGRSDFLWQNSSGEAVVWELNGTSLIGSGSIGNPGPAWHAVGAGDFNGDGRSDILWQNDNSAVAVWQLNGTSVIGSAIVGNPGPSWHVIGAGDYNGDGTSRLLKKAASELETTDNRVQGHSRERGNSSISEGYSFRLSASLRPE